jgi:hypothetical protein
MFVVFLINHFALLAFFAVDELTAEGAKDAKTG